MILTRSLENAIVFGGRRYRLNLAFDTVLLVYEVQREPTFSADQRLQLSVELLIGRCAARLSAGDLKTLFERIDKEFLNPDAVPPDPAEKRALDFTQDAPLIYAAFLQAYNIDLSKERRRLDWRHFIALFQGLPDNTRIRDVMDIRQRKVPDPNKHNGEQIDALLKAKAFYAIKVSDEEAEATLQAGIDRMAAGLIARAKRGV